MHAQATLVSRPVTIAGNGSCRALPPAPKMSGTIAGVGRQQSDRLMTSEVVGRVRGVPKRLR